MVRAPLAALLMSVVVSMTGGEQTTGTPPPSGATIATGLGADRNGGIGPYVPIHFDLRTAIGYPADETATRGMFCLVEAPALTGTWTNSGLPKSGFLTMCDWPAALNLTCPVGGGDVSYSVTVTVYEDDIGTTTTKTESFDCFDPAGANGYQDTAQAALNPAGDADFSWAPWCTGSCQQVQAGSAAIHVELNTLKTTEQLVKVKPSTAWTLSSGASAVNLLAYPNRRFDLSGASVTASSMGTFGNFFQCGDDVVVSDFTIDTSDDPSGNRGLLLYAQQVGETIDHCYIVDVQGTGWGLILGGDAGQPVCDYTGAIDVTLTQVDANAGDLTNYFWCNSGVVMGNTMDRSNANPVPLGHGFRFPHNTDLVFAHNRVSGWDHGSSAVTIREGRDSGFTSPNERGVYAYNTIGPLASNDASGAAEGMSFTPENDLPQNATEYVRDNLILGNFCNALSSHADFDRCIKLASWENQIVANVGSTDGSSFRIVLQGKKGSNPDQDLDNNHVIANTLCSVNNASGALAVINGDCTDCGDAKNNLYVDPGGDALVVLTQAGKDLGGNTNVDIASNPLSGGSAVTCPTTLLGFDLGAAVGGYAGAYFSSQRDPNNDVHNVQPGAFAQ